MGIGSPEARGEQRRIFCRPKTAYATSAPAFASANTLRVLDFKANVKQKREKRQDNRQTLGHYQKIPGMKEGTWSLEMELQGSGALGTPWSCAPFLAFAFGNEVATPATDVVYTLDDAQTALGWLDFLQELNEVLSLDLRNCWMNELKISWKGGSNHKLMASGGISDWIFTGSGALEGALSGGEAFAILETDDELRFRIGSRVIIGSSNPSSTGHTISAVTDGTQRIDFSPVVSGAQADAAIVRPWVPTEAAPPDVISGILGQASIGGDLFDVSEGEISWLLNLEPHDDEAFIEVVEDYGRSWRDVSGFIKFRAYRDQIVVLQQREDDDNRYALNFELGETAGNIMEIDLPQVEYDFGDLEVPNKGTAMVTLPFDAMTSDSETSDEASVICR